MSHTFRKLFSKQAAALLTPQAQAAASQPMPAPAMPPPAAPMDPAMMGAAPAAAAPAPMPAAPAGAPMDPAIAAGAAPAPAPAAPAGDPAQNPMFIQFLQEVVGITMDQSGQFIDPNGQPVPPEAIAQIYGQFMQEMQAAQAGGGMPPQDPAAAAPGAEQGAQPGFAGDPEQNPMIDAIASIVMDAVQSVIDEKLAGQDKKISAMLEKMDSIKTMLDQMVSTTDKRTEQDKQTESDLNSDLDKELQAAAPVQAVPAMVPIADMLQQPKTASAAAPNAAPMANKHLSFLAKLRGVK